MRGPALLLVALLAAGCVLPGGPEPRRPYYEEVLSGAPFTDLVVEVDHAPGHAPSLAARAHLLETLRNVTSKARVTLVLEATLPDTPDERWTADELVALERETRTTRHEAPVAVLHVLYPSGRYERDGVAGVTVSGPVLGPIVVFLDTLDDLGTPLGALPMPAPALHELERATLLHEAGHAVGLVDNGLPQVRDREDAANEGHSSNPRSVMYWKVESVNGLRELLLDDGSVPDTFDADDLADLRSAGGR